MLSFLISVRYVVNFNETYRISHRGCSVKKVVLRNFAKFTGKHLLQRHFLNQVAGLRPATLLKKGLWLWIFSKFLRTPFLQNTSGRLLLYLVALNWIIFVNNFLIGALGTNGFNAFANEKKEKAVTVNKKNINKDNFFRKKTLFECFGQLKRLISISKNTFLKWTPRILPNLFQGTPFSIFLWFVLLIYSVIPTFFRY